MTATSVGASWKEGSESIDLAKIERAFREPSLSQGGSLLTRPGVEFHIQGFITHGVPLPETWDHYIELTTQAAEAFKTVTSAETLNGKVILRGGNFELVHSSVMHSYNNFVEDGYKLETLLANEDNSAPLKSIAREIRTLRDSIILEAEDAHDRSRGANLGDQISRLGEALVKFVVAVHPDGSDLEHSKDDRAKIVNDCLRMIEDTRYDDSANLISDEHREKINRALDSSGIFLDSWDEAKTSAGKWLNDREAQRRLRASVI